MIPAAAPLSAPCALEVVSVATNGTQGNNSSSYASISGDGQVVAFMSTANNLVANDTNVGVDVFVRNRTTGTTIRASVKSNGDQAVAGSQRPKISADGTVVAFASSANDLVPSDTNNLIDVFVRDLVAGTTSRVSVATGGTQDLNGGTDVTRPALSADGRYVVFDYDGLDFAAAGGTRHVYRHDVRRPRPATTPRCPRRRAASTTATSSSTARSRAR